MEVGLLGCMDLETTYMDDVESQDEKLLLKFLFYIRNIRLI